MNKLDELTRRLASQTPKLSNADALCNSIMGQLPQRHKPQNMTIVSVLRVAASIAAILLIILFIHQSQSIDPLQEDPDYGKSLELVRPDYSQFEDLNPREALHLFAKTKRERTTLSQLKKNYAL